MIYGNGNVHIYIYELILILKNWALFIQIHVLSQSMIYY